MMLKHRRVAVAGVLFTSALGCSVLERGPTDDEVIAAVRKSPPEPPTLGPTYLAQIEVVEVKERGNYHRGGGYWPVRVRVKGAVQIKVTNAFQLGVLGDGSSRRSEPADFVEDARFLRDDFGHWQVAYSYDRNGPAWRATSPIQTGR